MDDDEAWDRIERALEPNQYFGIGPKGHPRVSLDGDFSATQLRLIADVLDKYSPLPEGDNERKN